VQAMLQVATMFAHQGNQDGAQFLFFVAKQLAKELGLYPEVSNQVVTQE
jgi:ABC-type Fe3+ transport system substrate-binding protein